MKIITFIVGIIAALLLPTWSYEAEGCARGAIASGVVEVELAGKTAKAGAVQFRRNRFYYRLEVG